MAILPFSGKTTTAATQAAGNNTTKIANTAFVTTAINTAIAGVNPAVAVKFATTAAGDTSGYTYNNGASGIGATLTGANNVAFTADGQTATALLQRVLVKNDTQSPSGAFNGVYYVSQVQTAILPPILTRAIDYNQPSDINNTGAIPVVLGTANAQTTWVLTSTVTTVGTDPLTFTQFSLKPSTIVTLTGSQALTNKDLTGAGNTFPTFNQDTTGKSAKTDALNSATTVVNVASATAPSANQVLTATDSTHATWQAPQSAQITTSTTTNITGLLAGNGSNVGAVAYNATPTANNIPVLDANHFLPLTALAASVTPAFNDAGSTITGQMLVQTGRPTAVAGNNTNTIDIAVTFSTAFKTATTPRVVANIDMTVGSNSSNAFGGISALSNTGFTFRYTCFTGTLSSGSTYSMHWIAVGQA